MAAPQDSEHIVRRYIQEVLEKGDMNVFEELVDPNFVSHDSSAQHIGMSGAGHRETAKQGINELHKAVGNLKYDIDNISSQGDQVTVRGTVHGTHRGQLMGMAPTGKQARVPYTATVRVVNGKIVEGSSQWDVDEVKRQLTS